MGPVTVADLIKDICANPSAEDAKAIYLKMSAAYELPGLEIDEKVQDYTETVCGYEKSDYFPEINKETMDAIIETFGLGFL